MALLAAVLIPGASAIPALATAQEPVVAEAGAPGRVAARDPAVDAGRALLMRVTFEDGEFHGTWNWLGRTSEVHGPGARAPFGADGPPTSVRSDGPSRTGPRRYPVPRSERSERSRSPWANNASVPRPHDRSNRMTGATA